MYLKCPKCNEVNIYFELVVPYYICSKCGFGEREYKNYRFDGSHDIERYHLEFWTAVKKIEEEKEINKMIEGVLDD